MRGIEDTEDLPAESAPSTFGHARPSMKITPVKAGPSCHRARIFKSYGLAAPEAFVLVIGVIELVAGVRLMPAS